MKLHALNRIFLMTKPHNRAIRRTRRDFKRTRQALLGHDQRMVARACHWIPQAVEDRLAVVLYFARLAMHQLPRANNIAAKRSANRLMPKADAKNRHLASESAHDVDRDARIVRRTGSR